MGVQRLAWSSIHDQISHRDVGCWMDRMDGQYYMCINLTAIIDSDNHIINISMPIASLLRGRTNLDIDANHVNKCSTLLRGNSESLSPIRIM